MPETGKKGGPGKLSPSADKRVEKKALVIKYYFQGYSQAAIVEKVRKETNSTLVLGTVENWISEHLAALKETRPEMITNFKYVEVEKINRLEREYWAAWERSMEPQVLTRETFDAVEGARASKKKPAGKLRSVIRETKTQPGEVKFLQGSQWCIEQRIKILGLEAPTKNKIGEEGEDAAAVIEGANKLGSGARIVRFTKANTTAQANVGGQ